MIIEHACSRHQSEPLQFRKVVVHPSSGKFGYSRILYNELIPLELEVKGKNIKSENSDVIVVGILTLFCLSPSYMTSIIGIT